MPACSLTFALFALAASLPPARDRFDGWPCLLPSRIAQGANSPRSCHISQAVALRPHWQMAMLVVVVTLAGASDKGNTFGGLAAWLHRL